MAHEKALMAVPRGLPRDLTVYLQSLNNVVSRLAGIGRGTETARAVRVNEGIMGKKDTGPIDAARISAGSISGDKLADGSVTEAKLAENAVTAKKIASGSIGASLLANGAVGEAKLSNNSVSASKIRNFNVTAEKLARDLWPVFVEGTGTHGETINLGKWLDRPLVGITGHRIPVADCGEICAEIVNLRENNGHWFFDVHAVCELGEEDGEKFYPGEISWQAMGRKENGQV